MFPFKQDNMWIQSDGAPSHFRVGATEDLNASYRSWLDLVPIAWTVRPLDLTLLNFLWGCIKSKVHHTGKLETRQQLLECINEAAAAIRNEMPQNIRCSTE
jgi:hypothetical protein